ncbi:MAG: hypothetical protein MZW92_38645 [Comamonadaceae bacterium]|nr:hypothetical protein [Comamonadaceae bacterium]
MPAPAGALFICALIAASAVSAVDAAQVPKDRQTRLGLYYTAAEANAYIAAHRGKTLFIDVRDPGRAAQPRHAERRGCQCAGAAAQLQQVGCRQEALRLRRQSGFRRRR